MWPYCIIFDGMTKFILTLLSVALSFVVLAQEASAPAEPSSSQRMILYGMTALGVALILLAFRNKLIRKK